MKVIVLMICLLFSVSCKTNDLISTALCLIRNKTVKEEALNILNKILNKDYENIFQDLATAYFKVKDVLLNQCLNKDDVNPAVLRNLDSQCNNEKIDFCINICIKTYNAFKQHKKNLRLPDCDKECHLYYCSKDEE